MTATVVDVPPPTSRRAGWLVTGASTAVALFALVVVLVLDAGTTRTVLLAVAVAAAFSLAAWRAVRARRDTSAVHGARPISSWIAAFSGPIGRSPSGPIIWVQRSMTISGAPFTCSSTWPVWELLPRVAMNLRSVEKVHCVMTWKAWRSAL